VRSTRWRAEAALAVLFSVVMLVVGGGAIWVMSRKPVHESAAAVPSTAAAAHSDRYAGPVEESRRLARALVAGDNLPGLSVAVAVDGEIVWAEGFGWADVDSRTPITRFRLGALSKLLTVDAPRVWSVDDLCAGLDGQERAARRRAGTDPQSPGQSRGRHRLAPDVRGSRCRDCRRCQRDGCQGR
jgi:hypothetical protein